jgi:hypothetical protein
MKHNQLKPIKRNHEDSSYGDIGSRQQDNQSSQLQQPRQSPYALGQDYNSNAAPVVSG